MVMMADRDDGTSAAMRRRQRRLRSWWRHEQRSVAAALAAATHHSAPRSGWLEQHDAPRGPTTASAMEGEVRGVYEVLREQKPPLPGMRPAPLSEVAGPLGRLVAPACPSGGVPALVPVVMVQEAAHDDATVSYLLSQTLLAEQEAKEVEELEAKLADREHRLMTSIRELRGRYDLRDQFTRLETQVIGWAGIKWEVEKKKEKKRKRKKRKKRKLPRAPRPREGRRRPCDHQRHVLAVRGASVPVHRQSGGHSCFMSVDLADPASSERYSRVFVFNAPVAEPSVMSFTVSWNGYSIVATATVVTSCSCGLSLRECLRRDVVRWWFYSWLFLRFGLDSVRPMTGNYLINYFQYQEVVGCVCMLDYWFISNDEICADNYIYFRFKFKDNCRSEKWELYLYGDKSIKVDRDSVEMLSRGVPLPGFRGVGFGSSPNLATVHTSLSCACLLNVALYEHESGSSSLERKYCGTCVSTVPAVEPAVMSFTVFLTGSTIDAIAAVHVLCVDRLH